MLLLLLSLFLAFPSLIAASATCYFRNGNVAPNSYKPCNINATGTTNSHSACCDTDNGDVCLASGVCFYPGPAQGAGYSFFYADGCTDKNLADASCQTFCPSTTNNVQQVMNCGGGNFCCSDSATNVTACCGGKTFTLSNGFGAPINQTTSNSGGSSTAAAAATVTVTSGSSSDDNNGSKKTDNTAVAVVGGVLGALLAIALATIAFLLWKLRSVHNGYNTGHSGYAAPSSEVYKAEHPLGELSGTPGPFELSENRR